MNWVDSFTAISSLATAVGVFFAAIQLMAAKNQAVRDFEDGFAKEYRELANRLPASALLGLALTEEEGEEHFDEFFRYFDLCNEQIYLRIQNRIRIPTWEFWSAGMQSNFRKPAFAAAWERIERSRTNEFSELRRLLASEFIQDPRRWPRKR
ncbi:MAG: hypothetical protein H7A48_12790 [Akkermansiaceae bacterium]|nr:hypothetical protein [Akkermansiaceae bacterium]